MSQDNEHIVIPVDAWKAIVNCLVELVCVASASHVPRVHLSTACKIVAEANPCLTEPSEPTGEGEP